MSVLMIGAGKTGRGYLARLLTESGISVVLADSDKELMRTFPERYDVSFFSDREKAVIIPEYAGDMDDPVIHKYCRSAGCIFVSVGMENLADVGEKLEVLIPDWCHVILCENGNDACSEFMEKNEGRKAFQNSAGGCFLYNHRGGGLQYSFGGL